MPQSLVDRHELGGVSRPARGDTGGVADDDFRDRPDPKLVPVRRRPDLARFLIIGAVVGAVVGGLVGYLGPDAPSSSLLQEVLLLGAVGALVLGLLAALLYLLADRRSARG